MDYLQRIDALQNELLAEKDKRLTLYERFCREADPSSDVTVPATLGMGAAKE